MRLSQKFTISFTAISVLVLLLGITINYLAIDRASFQNNISKLQHINQLVKKDIKHNHYKNPKSKLLHTKIYRLEQQLSKDYHVVKSQNIWNKDLQTEVTHIEVTHFFRNSNQSYKVSSSRDHLLLEGNYFTGIIMVFLWTFVFLIMLVVVLTTVISVYLLDPFYKALINISNFRVNQPFDKDFKANTTFEFTQLNTFLEQMMRQSQTDYNLLKEFTENASHELQTPIAVMQAKVDLLMQTTLDADQAQSLGIISKELDKLSRTKAALTTLMKLEQLTLDKTPVNFTTQVSQKVANFEDLTEIKNIVCTTAIDQDIVLNLNPQLMDMVLNNLFSNAINHNNTQNKIHIKLTTTHLEISNTGDAPHVDPTHFFKRFTKNDTNTDSSGIGLSIVQKIIHLHNFEIYYTYVTGMHHIKIKF